MTDKHPKGKYRPVPGTYNWRNGKSIYLVLCAHPFCGARLSFGPTDGVRAPIEMRKHRRSVTGVAAHALWWCPNDRQDGGK